MALKVQLSTGMKELETRIHKPVTFINGEKKILSKGITFINGQKKYLWGADGVPVDYIKSDGVACGYVHAIGETWMHTSGNGNVFEFNISNLDNPSVVQRTAWGNVLSYCGYQSTGTDMVFSCAGKKMVVDPSGSITIPVSHTTAGTHFRGITNGYSVGTSILTKTFTTSGRITTYQYGNNYYWNGSLAYSTGTPPASAGGSYTQLIVATDVSATPSSSVNPLILQRDACLIQNGDNSLLVNLASNQTGLSGLYSATPSGVTKIRDLKFGLNMLDGNYICGNGTTAESFCLYDSSFVAVKTYTLTGWKLSLIGRLGDYYYLLARKDGVSKLIVLTNDNLTFVLETVLPVDPFEENSGADSFWGSIKIIPQVSKTGFLGASYYNSGVFRCVRFGELL